MIKIYRDNYYEELVLPKYIILNDGNVFTVFSEQEYCIWHELPEAKNMVPASMEDLGYVVKWDDGCYID